jgi:hypothetical protein
VFSATVSLMCSACSWLAIEVVVQGPDVTWLTPYTQAHTACHCYVVPNWSRMRCCMDKCHVRMVSGLVLLVYSNIVKSKVCFGHSYQQT